MQILFYPTDTYATAKHKFNNAWPNLSLEVNYATAKYWHEGWDEFEEDTPMIDKTDPAIPVFSLTEEMLAGEVIQLFSTHFSGEAMLVRTGVSVEMNETLAYSNDPFILPINKIIYSDYQRRFTGRWTNLSVHLYNTANKYMELEAHVLLQGRKGVPTALNDYTFISEWRHTLSRIHLCAAIQNNQLNISWEGDMRPLRIKEFQALKKKEDAYG